jgi:RND superfamily putative drug exporter
MKKTRTAASGSTRLNSPASYARWKIGLKCRTARVIFAAATIKIAVFFSFVFEDTRVIKEFGLGLGVAILVEALLIRLSLFPDVMGILGDRAWCIPAWLDQILPRLDIENPSDKPPVIA